MSTEIRVQLGSRLAQERERLQLKQAEFARLSGVKPRTLQDWERGVSTPAAEFLAVAATHGIDVLFVLTGQRTPVATDTLNEEQKALLDNYDHADEEGRAAARRVLSSLAKQKTE